MDDERSQRDQLNLTEQERIVESAVLALMVEAHPRLYTLPRLIEDATRHVMAPGGAVTVERAVESLIIVELVHRRGQELEPTPAALRAGELEMGL